MAMDTLATQSSHIQCAMPLSTSSDNSESGDSKSKKFLFEGISLAIQHGNAASIRGTFPDSALLSEIFVLYNKNFMYLT
jgi:hypothetical protein